MCAIGDVNGDGVADIAVSDNDSNTITLFLMSKKGNISTSSMIMVGNHPKGHRNCRLKRRTENVKLLYAIIWTTTLQL